MKTLRNLAARAERQTGLPGRFMLPAGIAGLGLNIAVVGMYWDIGYHVDHGRDANPITSPHMLIVTGNKALAEAYAVHVLDVYDHYRFRAIETERKRQGKKGWSGFLETDDKWQQGYVDGTKGALGRYFAK